jgi:hypothetical protein
MKVNTIRKYTFNCFLLSIPILIWNLILANKLPKVFQSEIFWKDIPPLISYGENISRFAIFGLMFFMPVSILTATQKKGIALYIIGSLLYFASWLMLIYFPYSVWSNTIFGFMAPAYTPLLWLLGIGFIGNSFYFNLAYKRWMFISIAIVFILFHCSHTYLIFLKSY